MPDVRLEISGGDTTVHYDLDGTGPGLVLVHGTAATREQWLPLTDAVKDRFTVVAPDYSGSGLTADHGGPLTLADLADEIVAAATDAGLGSFHLVGHSLGAAIATYIAGTHSGRVRSLVLHAGWVHTDTKMDAELMFWRELLQAGTGLFARMLPLAALGPKYWGATDPAANEALIAELAANIAPGTQRQIEVDRAVDLRHLLGRITAPTLVLASAHDRIIDPAQQKALLSGIAGARYAELDAGHGAHAEDPESFFAAITEFLDQHRNARTDRGRRCGSRRTGRVPSRVRGGG
ncbi:MAG TPA: alpha/beta fold hydrolase [Amycolatopsis sp.]|uniref:alpha/beta fold hydrolase n=1 Tax=Amycolatopsis sp. TaxID=37632 RepID=UPI002B462475|nr:alpha/beta fold hydrolase [Amycolatopsis sp.]HKS47202.1 alpha/beta fold hydrolase [Amycolatopsis sp.]